MAPADQRASFEEFEMTTANIHLSEGEVTHNEQQRVCQVNVGCGSTPTPGWMNFDNSLTIRLGRIPGLVYLLWTRRLIAEHQRYFAKVAKEFNVQWAQAWKLPLASGSVEAFYSSHMLEHLDALQVHKLFVEARRVLKPGGVIRLGVPDLHRLARQYGESGDADAFVQSTLMACPPKTGLIDRLQYLLVGERHHRWMYDAASLAKLLRREHFSDVREMKPGETMIPEPGQLNLREREDETVYVEAFR